MPAQRQLLVVDDDELTRRVLARYLRTHGYLVEEAADAETAFAWIGERTYDAILCDIHLPGVSGLDLLRYLVEDAEHDPVLLMTGDPDAALEGQARGAAGYLRKPFSFTELIEAVEGVLGRVG